ncbi:NAD-dependent epimerase/dehydratase family protein [Kitasatospora kifunensis]|uniref:Nucleoside-diphosphate-sugar epimerase n=1 Tax=Kitasatospora kifunensis TaxID=58351 RepID=A0A7W7VTB2_KITKI|nr:NAD(P)-dependent oxidoreductase [Kitasatospora kifunensis]MBB4921270.1 nucleoside-diphosphate-sugar epimerase [Kitasatospora kifunensis]
MAHVTTQQLLITGAAGRVGTLMRPRLARPGRLLRLLDIAPLPAPGAGEAVETLQASVTDLDAMREACAGVDAVIHLGGLSTERPWEQILDTNINGSYTVLEAARRAGVPRVVFASSNHAVGFHPADQGEAADYLFPRPDTFYGVSKVAGEALGSLYHDRYSLDVICLRIGSCFERPLNARMLATWLAPDDCARLLEAVLAAPEPGFKVVWGISANTRAWWSLAQARALGYRPQCDAEQFATELGDMVGEFDHRYLGGPFCSPELDAPKGEAEQEAS